MKTTHAEYADASTYEEEDATLRNRDQDINC